MVGCVERVLAECFAFDKINYLMLMIVDDHLHFHVIPRYEKARQFAGQAGLDPGWPSLPNFSGGGGLDRVPLERVRQRLCDGWAKLT